MEDNQKDGKIYNLIDLEEISGGSKEFMREMIKLFIAQSEKSIKGFKDALSNNDLLEIKYLAHQIKPSIDNIRITELSKVIREVEQLANQNQVSEELNDLIGKVNHLLDKVISQLEKELEVL